MIELTVNDVLRRVDADPEMPLSWVLRDKLGLLDTHMSCAAGICGTCTVHLRGVAIRSCQIPISAVAGQHITTIAGLSKHGRHPVQQAWIEEDVVQCGYCQSGFIMAVAAFLKTNAHPTDDEIDQAITNICRCGTFVRIRKAIHRAAELARSGQS